MLNTLVYEFDFHIRLQGMHLARKSGGGGATY